MARRAQEVLALVVHLVATTSTTRARLTPRQARPASGPGPCPWYLPAVHEEVLMRRACTTAVALMASLAAQAAQAGVWEHGTHKDKITGAVKATHLLKSDNTIELSFPYAGAQHAYIHVRDGDVMLTVQRGQILHREGARVNVDGTVTRIGLGESSDHDSTVAFPNLSSASVAGANSIKIEVTFYQNGNHVLEFTSPVPLKESAEWKAERLAAAEAAKRATAEAAKRADAVRKEAEVSRKRLEEERASNEVAALSTKLTDSLREACDQPALAIRWAVAGLHAENLTARAGRDSAKTALAPFTQCLAVNESRLPAEIADLRKTDLQREQERQAENQRQAQARSPTHAAEGATEPAPI